MRKRKAINVQIGANIQRARESAGLTQDKLSEQIGVTPNHISAIERGVYGISLENLQKMCQILNVSADFIIFGDTRLYGDSCCNDEMDLARRISAVDPKYKEYVKKGLSILLDMSEIE